MSEPWVRTITILSQVTLQPKPDGQLEIDVLRQKAVDTLKAEGWILRANQPADAITFVEGRVVILRRLEFVEDREDGSPSD